MEFAGFDQVPEAGYIQFVIAERIEAQGEPVAKQGWLLVRTARSQRFLELRPGDAEVVLGGSRRQVGPQQAKQKLAAVRMVRLDQKIGQQSDRLSIGERDCPQPAMLDLQSAE